MDCVQGKTVDQAKVILDQALRLQDAGCTFLLLEGMPRESAEMIATNLDIPVYGIGAGDKVDGQLVIMHDWLDSSGSSSPSCKTILRQVR